MYCSVKRLGSDAFMHYAFMLSQDIQHHCFSFYCTCLALCNYEKKNKKRMGILFKKKNINEILFCT